MSRGAEAQALGSEGWALARWLRLAVFGLMMAAGALLSPGSAQAQTDAWVDFSGGHCRICSNQTYACSNNHGYWNGGRRTFSDPLGAAYYVTQVEFQVEGEYGCSGNRTDMRYRLNSWHFSDGTGYGQCNCGSCDGWVNRTSPYYANGIPNYVYNGSNEVWLDVYSGLTCVTRVRVRLYYRIRNVTCYRDADGDGYGNPGVTTLLPSCTGGWVSNASDCNDSNRNIRPGATEVCNGVDDNCVGGVDEGLFRNWYYDGDRDGWGTSARYDCQPYSLWTSTSPGDCNDSNNAIYPGRPEVCNNVDDNCNGTLDEGVGGRTWYYDADGDTWGTDSNIFQCTASGLYRATRNGDCNDANGAVYPGRGEVCNGIDDNCAGGIDEGVRTRFYYDADGDTWGTASYSDLCSASGLYRATRSVDCNDGNAAIYPGRVEVCNNVDDDCDGSIDEGFTHRYYYLDNDRDNWGTTANIYECMPYGNYTATSSGDCNDSNGAVYPGRGEVCNGIDDNCAGGIDEGVTTRYYYDADNDTWGTTSSTLACSPSGLYRATRSGDCNDGNANAYPGRTEVCDSVDNDCDGAIDEGLLTRYYNDSDGDTWGTTAYQDLCGVSGTYRSTRSGDCNDSNGAVYPGRTEVCNGIDDNCVGGIDEGVLIRYYNDSDGDTWGTTAYRDLCGVSGTYRSTRSGDCNDGNAAVYPGRTEVCNGIDDNCVNGVDEGLLRAYYYDADNDSWGTTSVQNLCGPSGVYRASRSGDCNDGNAAVYPGRTEVCNGIDDNCVGGIDEGLRSNYYYDADGDTWGTTSVQNLCGPSGVYRATRSGDCNDGNAAVYPGRTEVCNGIDDNCVNGVDEGLLVRYYNDADNDSWGTTAYQDLCGVSGNYRATRSGDCNDSNGAVYPGRTEVCNGIDDNCVGGIDEGLLRAYYYDNDNDTWGTTSVQNLCGPSGLYRATRSGDCNDSNATAYPGATEVCDNVDNDCDAQIDEGLRQWLYPDNDRDNYGRVPRAYSLTTSQLGITTTWDYNNLPQATNDVVVTVWARGDIDSSGEYLGMTVDAYSSPNLFQYATCNNCWVSMNVTIPAATWNAQVQDGPTRFQVFNRSGVGSATVYLVINYTTDDRALVCPGPGYANSTNDCNDSNAAVNPGRAEVCGNGLDDNCNGQIDENILTFYRDADGDTWGTTATTQACAQPSGYTTRSGDCNDGNGAVYPGRTEVCNGIDDNCVNGVDEGLLASLRRDVDGDGWGSTTTGNVCPGTPGWTSNGIDCNDGNAAIYPGRTEICDNVDNDCDGAIDEGLRVTRYVDGDNDGYGRNTTANVCPDWTGYSTNNTDCNDANAAVSPGDPEVCGNNVDDNCNGQIDENIQTFYRDADGDGFGNPGSTTRACTRPTGYVTDNRDCNDGNANIRPTATEVCDYVDNDCDGAIDEGLQVTRYFDGDRDTYGTFTRLACPTDVNYANRGGDCNDGVATINPGAAEVCGNGVDDNCNGQIDENRLTFYRDRDADTWGDLGTPTLACTLPSGYVARGGDCNDNNNAINPGRAEVCNNIDDDCDGQTDEGLLVGRYRDADSDTWGAGALAQVCPTTAGYVARGGDCNDGNAAISPNALEVCDFLDNDCDGQTDEGNGGGQTYRIYPTQHVNLSYTTTWADARQDLVFAYNATSSHDIVGWMSFNLSTIPDDATVQSITLSLHQHPSYFSNSPYLQIMTNNVNGWATSVTSGAMPKGPYVSSQFTAFTANARNNFALTPGSISWGAELLDNQLNLGVDQTNTASGTRYIYWYGVASASNLRPYIDVTVTGNSGTLRVDRYRDVDGDNYGASLASVCSNTPGYVSAGGDCNDNNNAVNPGRAEVCGNNIDDNCNGQIDENLITYYRDNDRDTYGTSSTIRACAQPTGYATRQGDCNDNAATINPGAAEVCDAVDNDCDGAIDEGLLVTRYRDNDSDNYGTVSGQVCPGTPNWGVNPGDCDDTRANVNPGLAEVCGDNLDNNCNGAIDENLVTYYRDADNDTYGTTTTILACARPVGYATRQGDCNDGNAAINPAATEVCDFVDNDCDGQTDEGLRVTRYLDNDADTYGTTGASVCSNTPGYANRAGDCNDGNAAINPGAAEVCDFIDNDCDGQTDEGLRVTRYRDVDSDNYGTTAASVCSNTPGYANAAGDCNDNNAAVNPGAAEICGNNVDDNCNGQVDENIRRFYRDNDRDNYGDPNSSTLACTQPTGFVANNTDCNDNNVAINPGAAEVCDNVDNNCNGQTDEGLLVTRYVDSDRDNYGRNTAAQVCPNAPGYANNNTDCNDSNAAVNPGAAEVCGNNLDDNCNGQVDENTLTFYRDSDSDNFGDPNVSTRACTRPTGFVANNTDCNDADNQIFPGNAEVCDNKDNNCNGTVDEGLRVTRYRDADGDTYGTNVTSSVCPAWTGWATRNGDCNDGNASVNPGRAEVCGNNIDDNCNGAIDENTLTFYIDADSDTYGSTRTIQACTQPVGTATRGGDCNDSNSAVYPGATELCNNLDDDCDGQTDEGLRVTRYRDADGDTWGTSVTASVCPDWTGYASRNGDCDDSRSNVNPGATELCGNNLDDNCNGAIDENRVAVYRDFDGDTYGNPASSILACGPGSGYVRDNTDCNDGNVAINPAAAEACNGIDDNCNVTVDEGNPDAGVACGSGLPGACAETSQTVCISGQVVCGPVEPNGYGAVTTAAVPAGLLGRNTGAVDGNWKLVTSNGVYFFNLAYSINGGNYNGWTVRVFNPEDNFAVIKTFTLPGASFYTDGISARGDILYAVEWTANNGARVAEIDWRAERVVRTTTLNQGATQAIEGQYDWINNVHWLGALRFSANIYEHSGNELSTASQTRSFAAQGITEGVGAVASDGRYLYVKRWANYPGPTEIHKIGSGYGNTVRGFNYGLLANVHDTISTTYHPDGYLYVAGTGANGITRVRITDPRREVCGDNLDNNCNGGVDDYCPSPTPLDDFDSGLIACNWSVTSSHGSATVPSVADGVLKARLTTAVSGQPTYTSGLTSRFALRGDFDVQVDYRLVSWDGGNGVRVNLNAAGGTIHRLNERNNDERYTTNLGGQINSVPTTATSGRLRLVRQGSTLIGYYDDAGWRELSRRTGMSTGDTPVVLSIHGHNALPANAEVHFDNLVVASGTVTTPQALGPEVCDGADNDCDGATDENTDQVCSSACGTGVRACVNGALLACDARTPSQELCDDMVDNDCNGDTDEGCGGYNPFDNFNDGSLSTCRWTASASPAWNSGANSGARVDETTALRLRLGANTRGANFGAGATSRFGAQGDFDVQIDYNLASWPANSHVRVGLGASGQGTVERVGDRGLGEVYLTDFSGTVAGVTPTTARTGRLRLVRTGNVLRSFTADGNGAWTQNAQRAVTTADVAFHLNIWGHDYVTGDVEVQFDNLQFNGCNESPCRTWPGGRLINFAGLGTPEGVAHNGTCDALDNDCDGVTDGFNRACATACGAGTETCTVGTWGACTAQVPIAEVCDGRDNDCDNQIDEEDPNEGTFCNVSGQQGACAQGTRVCRGNLGLVCEGPSPSTEICDSLDNDCDGATDEVGNAPAVFQDDALVGYWSFEERSGSTFRDNAGVNNSGQIFRDARLGQSARYGNGLSLDGSQDYAEIPAEGTELDLDGRNAITIAGWFYPRAHTAQAFTIYRSTSYYLTMINGQPSFYGYGLTAPGYHSAPQALPLNQWSHVAATYDGSNVRLFVNGAQVHAVAVTGSFQADNSPLVFGHRTSSNNTTFNGLMDEVFLFRKALSAAEINSLRTPEMPGGGVTCGTGSQGVCADGASVCQAGQFLCNAPLPSAETCDSLDNDCDGQTDEGNPQGGGSCATGNPGVCAVGSYVCTSGALVCNAVQPGQRAEVCDGADNDCDGQTDESFPGQGGACTVNGARGVCAAGALACVSGGEVCVGPQPSAESCDNRDNDCDGQTDETLTRACSTICGGGVEACSAGTWGGCTARQPTAEICDSADNDCDGQTDENIRRTCRTACGGGTEVCVNGGFTACSAQVPSAELCDGLDNNCNGFIDDAVDCGCQYFPEDEPVRPSLEWMWSASNVAPTFNQVMMTPVVANIDDDNSDNLINTDDTPDVAFIATEGAHRDGGYLRVVNGDDGAEKWAYTARKLAGGSSPAIGDLDGDGVPEIVAYAWRDLSRGAPNNAGLVAIDNQGNELWNNTAVNESGHYELGSPAIADIDPTRPGAEIATCFWLVGADGQTIWNKWSELPNGYSPRGFCSPAVADIDGDSYMEIVIGARAYNHDGTTLWSNNTLYTQWGSDYDIAPAIADLDGDGNPEVIVVRTRVFVLDAATGNLLANLSLPGGGQGGAPNVADFDGDGLPEIGTAGGSNYTVFKFTRPNGMPRLDISWTSTIRDFSSSITGSSVFDFNGDGVADVVYNDELYLRVYNGQTGQIVFEERNWSGTGVEYPVIVDVDNDDNAEILVARNQVGDYHDDYIGGWDGTPRAGLRVYGDANDNWVNTRKVWNQYSYHITNVGDNASIPAVEANSWDDPTSNGYRINFQGEQGLFSAPDLTVTLANPPVQGDDAGNYPNTAVPYCPAFNRVSLRICNDGDAVINDDIEFEVYAGDPNAGGTLVASQTVALRLNTNTPNNCTTATIEWNSTLQGVYDVYVVGDTSGRINECDEDNNTQLLDRMTLTPISQEKCDGADNDCDMALDEDNNGDPLSRACVTQCGNGTETCEDGAWAACDAGLPTTEVCDAFDNDCNGTINDDPSDCLDGEICVQGSIGDYICVSGLTVNHGECELGCPLGTICDEEGRCIPYCESDNACPPGEVCGDDNLCAPDQSGDFLGQDDAQEPNADRAPTETPLGSCASGAFARGAAPAGGLGALLLLALSLLLLKRRP
jgi:hypothetical protein